MSKLIEVLTKDGSYSLRSVFFQENFHSLLGALEETKSKFTATSNLQRFKETDRLKVMARQLQKFGAEITEKEDGLIINGKSKFHSAEVDSETDHRVAMSLAIASLLAKGTSKIMRADAASVSYPTFWEELAKLTN